MYIWHARKSRPPHSTCNSYVQPCVSYRSPRKGGSRLRTGDASNLSMHCYMQTPKANATNQKDHPCARPRVALFAGFRFTSSQLLPISRLSRLPRVKHVLVCFSHPLGGLEALQRRLRPPRAYCSNTLLVITHNLAAHRGPNWLYLPCFGLRHMHAWTHSPYTPPLPLPMRILRLVGRILRLP